MNHSIDEFINSRTAKYWRNAVVLDLLCVISLAVFLNRDGCWFYLSGTEAWLILGCVFCGLLCLFIFASIARYVVLAILLFVVALCSKVDVFPQAHIESEAIATLQQLAVTLHKQEVVDPKTNNDGTYYKPANVVQKYYAYRYVPYEGGRDESTRKLMIQATPTRCECGIVRSFTIMPDGRIYYTTDRRPATPSDTLLDSRNGPR